VGVAPSRAIFLIAQNEPYLAIRAWFEPIRRWVRMTVRDDS
jgi:hypothetical protein